MIINPKVCDVYQGDRLYDLAVAKEAGLLGIIHKATQFVADHSYAGRRVWAGECGLLWGAYHFNTGENVQTQAHRFLSVAEPDASTLCCLDLEPYPRNHQPMSLAMAREFMEIVDDATKRKTWLYSGSAIKALIVGASQADREFFADHPFWICQYNVVPVMTDENHRPLPWTKPDLWQYTGDGIGPLPHTLPGLQPNIDLNSWAGTDQALRDLWLNTPAPAPAAAA